MDAGEQMVSRSTHGTGCAFSSALLSRLVLGDSGRDAAARAKEYVAEAIRRATPMGKGLGPVNHLWPRGPLLCPAGGAHCAWCRPLRGLALLGEVLASGAEIRVSRREGRRRGLIRCLRPLDRV